MLSSFQQEHIPRRMKVLHSLDSQPLASSSQVSSSSSVTCVKKSPMLSGGDSLISLKFETTKTDQNYGKSGSSQYYGYEDPNNTLKHRRFHNNFHS